MGDQEDYADRMTKKKVDDKEYTTYTFNKQGAKTNLATPHKTTPKPLATSISLKDDRSTTDFLNETRGALR